nr:aldo/keto reductase [Parascardovia denticolens]
MFQIPRHDECKQAVTDALEVGYRLIDTAQFYRNERAVGEALEESGLPRREIFLTTKVWINNFGYDKTIESVKRSLRLLRTDYLDLVLIHQVVGNYLWAYRALEDLYKDGLVKAIGVSNMEADRLIDLATRANVVPAVNQIENHVFFQQNDLLAVMKDHGIQGEAWGPFAEGKNDLFIHPLLTEIGTAYDKSAAQVALRFLAQRGLVVIPKSTHRDRMEQNLDIWDFALSEDDMDRISSLDTGKSLFGYAKMFSNIQRLGLFTAKKKD